MRAILKGATTIAAATLAACAQKADGQPAFTHADCRRVAVVDAATNEAVVGAEDLAFDAATNSVIFSAYDRRAAEHAARDGRDAVPEGGLYSARLAALAANEVSVEPLIAQASMDGGLRPHGVSFDAESRRVSFINRAYRKLDGKWRMTPEIVHVGVDRAEFTDEDAPRCSANDLATLNDVLYVSYDHDDCGWRGGLEDVFGSTNSGVSIPDGESVFYGVRHANGLVPTGDGRLALAATRDKAIVLLQETDGKFSVEKKFAMPGAPDNLTVAADGAIVAALHPSLTAIGLARRMGFGKAGSRIVSVDPETGATTLLFDDPKAALFQAATAAVYAEGVLVAGSVLDAGLLVCARETP